MKIRDSKNKKKWHGAYYSTAHAKYRDLNGYGWRGIKRRGAPTFHNPRRNRHS